MPPFLPHKRRAARLASFTRATHERATADQSARDGVARSLNPRNPYAAAYADCIRDRWCDPSTLNYWRDQYLKAQQNR